ncbi:MAG: peptidoglycan DD-metalloendopeptidase family protein [Ignavibacteriales bacterium]|nr:peptidoglycan DD-metalloendopeptidase family protein [Ignavibacteriales bacterium]
MVRVFFYIVLFAILISVEGIYSQSEKIETKKKELQNLKDEISKLENDLAQKNRKEKKSLEDLENINKQNFLLSKLLTTLRSEENQKQTEIENQTLKISDIEKEIDLLQKNYAKYVKATYKHGSYTDWESIVNSESFNQAVMRLEYLKRFSVSRKKDLEKLETNKKDLITAKKKLEVEKHEKEILTKQKESEETVLKKKLKDQKNVLAEIKKDKKKIQKSVNDKRKAEQKIGNMIGKLVEEAEKKRIAEEKKRKEKELEKNKTVVSKDVKSKDVKSKDKIVTKKEVETEDYNVDLSTSKFSSFTELKGKLNWPITKGKVVRKFGESLNPNLKTVTVNYGIDIKASGDLSVKNVAEGVVSTVEWLPGYGTVLIVSHSGNYRTVYGHLSEVFVKEGDKIKSGGVIGKVGESVEGNLLHFELWNARQYVNPELWLR